MLEPLGINERLVRTSLFRLREENWVYPTRAGRRSYYRLTDTAVSKTKLAEQLIYRQQDKQWDGSWTLVFLVDTDIADDVRRELLQELQWVGFGTVTRKVLAHPGEASAMVSECIKRLGLSGKIIVMNSKNMHDIQLGFTSDDRELARRCLPYAESEQCYADFLSSFTPLLDKSGKLKIHGSDEQKLTLRLLMIDDYRRAILRDHHLPSELLPKDWAGTRAYTLCANIYKEIYQDSTEVYSCLQTEAGEIPLSYQANDHSSRFKTIDV